MTSEIDEYEDCHNWAVFGSVSLAADMVRQLNNETAAVWQVVPHRSHYHVLTIDNGEAAPT